MNRRDTSTLSEMFRERKISIGGFLGMGTHLVVIPYETLKFVDKKVMLPGGTRDGLKMLPEFKYAER